jgi:hypothetical protein
MKVGRRKKEGPVEGGKDKRGNTKGIFYSKYVSFCSIAGNNLILYSVQLLCNIDHSTRRRVVQDSLEGYPAKQIASHRDTYTVHR